MSTPLDKGLWTANVLNAMGNPSPTGKINAFLLGWEIHESGNSSSVGCDFNPLNLSGQNQGEPAPCGTCNGLVNNYCNYWDGVQASASRITTSNLYSALGHALRTNDEQNLGLSPHADGKTYMATNVAGDLSTWVSGKSSPIDQGYIDGIFAAMGQKPVVVQGSDIGQKNVTIPNPLTGIDAIGNFFAQLGTQKVQMRIVKGVLGVLLIAAGAYMVIRILVLPKASEIIGAIT